MSLPISEAKSITGKMAKKRIFIGLLVCSMLFILGLVALAWWLVAQRALLVNRVLLTIIIAGALFFFSLLGVGLLGLVWSLWRSKELTSLQGIMHTATSMLFPLAVRLGRLLGMDEEKIKNSYIQVSNQLVRTQTRHKTFRKVLILAPHCLQWIHCPHKITINVYNCKGCGKCLITDLIKLAERTGSELVVVTGGTLARKMIKQIRPDAVVAIACERDLTSGIQDVVGIPVYGVINDRPEGPCANTRVDLTKVEEAIRYFQQKDAPAEPLKDDPTAQEKKTAPEKKEADSSKSGKF